MDKNTIALNSRHLETKEDLLNLLNFIKQEHILENRKSYPFTIKQLNYYCNPNNLSNRYTQFEIKKKTGGVRLISAPKNNSYKLILRSIKYLLATIYTPTEYATGFTFKRSVVTNANIHKGQNYVFNIDLKDFFPSISQARIWKRLQLEPFCFKQNIANILAGLCSMRTESIDGSKLFVLPQGAPTSPIITNMICDKLDYLLARLAKRFGLKYSRYADDITFSSMHNVYHVNGKFIKELNHIITAQGFSINEKKTRLQKQENRQEVTGIIVNKKLNVPQDYVRDIRNLLFIWERYGYNTACCKFATKYISEKPQSNDYNLNMIKIIHGKLAFLKTVKGHNDPVYNQLYNKFILLKNSINKLNIITNQKIKHLETISIIKFEQQNDTTITIYWPNISTPNENTLTLHKKRPYAYFGPEREKKRIVISSNLKTTDISNKDSLLISSFIDINNNQFWIMHKSILSTPPPNIPFDLDQLNNELDSLIKCK